MAWVIECNLCKTPSKFRNFHGRPTVIDLVTVFDAILTSRQTCEKLQCLYENVMPNNFRKMAVLKKLWLMYQSIPAATSPPPPTPPGWPPGISILFALDGKCPGVGTLELSNPPAPGAGTKKEGKCAVLRQHCNISHWSHSRIVPF